MLHRPSIKHLVWTVAAQLWLTLVAIPASSEAKGVQPALPAGTRVSTQKRSTEGYLAEGDARSASRLALPFKRQWQYLTAAASLLPPTIDDHRIYLPLAQGRLDCLDRETGKLLWSAEPGGVITSPVAVSESVAYIATSRLGADGAEAGGSLRAIDCATGLTVWVRDYPRPFTSPLALGPGRLYAGSADGALYALRTNGEVIWTAETSGVVRGEALVTAEVIYFGSDDGAVRGVEPVSGKEVWKFQTGGSVGARPAVEKGVIFFGSADAFVYCVDLASGKLRWRSRVGAAVEASVVLVEDRLLAASLDNFVYALSRARGDRLWKRRLDSRIAATPIVDGDAALIAPLRGSRVAVFLTSDGRAVNFYQLDPELEIVAAPVFSGDLLVLPTDKGIVTARAAAVADNPSNAIKK